MPKPRKDRVVALEQRIKAKLKELDDDKEARQRARERVHRVDARIDELRDELTAVRGRLQRRRAILDEVRAELQELEAETPDEDTEEEQALRVRLDELAGEYEQAIDTRDRLLSKLDLLQERDAEARKALESAVAESDEDRKALEKMRARRQRIRERRKEKEAKASEHFDYAEFDCNDGTPLPKQSEPAVRDWCQKVGEPLRKKFGAVHINSGFRHRAYNASVGGESNSVHIYDFPGRDYKAVAVDITCERGTPSEWYEFTSGKADGRGLYSTFHHSDTRSRIGWPGAVWRG